MNELLWFGWKVILKAGGVYVITWLLLAIFPKFARIGGIETLWLRTLSWVIIAGIIIMIIAASEGILLGLLHGGSHVPVR